MLKVYNNNIIEFNRGDSFTLTLSINEGTKIDPLYYSLSDTDEVYFGIMEPVREKSMEIPPEEIDLVICPCTVFDENCGRMGMGAGFYDRYLAKCVNAHIAAVAFEVQKADSIPMEPWDKPMEMVFTEAGIYYKKT